MDSSKIIYVQVDGALLGLTEEEYIEAIKRGKAHLRHDKESRRAAKKFESQADSGEHSS